MMPDTAHQTNAAQPAPAGADCAVGTSMARSPMPKPSMVSKIWITSDAKTPASTADHVHPKKALGTVRETMTIPPSDVPCLQCGDKSSVPNRNCRCCGPFNPNYLEGVSNMTFGRGAL